MYVELKKLEEANGCCPRAPRIQGRFQGFLGEPILLRGIKFQSSNNGLKGTSGTFFLMNDSQGDERSSEKVLSKVQWPVKSSALLMEPTRYEQASDYTDSDDSSYASSCEDAESSKDPDSPCSTPRSDHLVTSLPLGPLPPEGQISPKRTVKPKIPTLGLRLDGGGVHRGPGSATPRTAVQPESARGRPSLSIPRLPTARAAEDPAAAREPPAAAALAAPVPRWSQHSSARASSLPTPQPVGLDRCDGEASCAAAVSISLMSDAFVLEQQGTIKGPQLASNALEKFSAALGVRQSELTLYEVREVKEGMQLAPRTSKLAVAVKNSGVALRNLAHPSKGMPLPTCCVDQSSVYLPRAQGVRIWHAGFSLGSVEKLLEENRRLKAEAEAGAHLHLHSLLKCCTPCLRQKQCVVLIKRDLRTMGFTSSKPACVPCQCFLSTATLRSSWIGRGLASMPMTNITWIGTGVIQGVRRGACSFVQGRRNWSLPGGSAGDSRQRRCPGRRLQRTRQQQRYE